MREQVLLYISAATDLEGERDLIARAVTEIPVDLGWRIVQSPRRNKLMDEEAISNSDVHLLLIGSDIRAPIGMEWTIARRAGRQPVPFLKQTVQRTPAALNYIRFIKNQTSWQPYKDGPDLHHQVLQLLSDFLLNQALRFHFTLPELEQLHAWRSELKLSEETPEETTQGGAGDSSIILSIDGLVPPQYDFQQSDEEGD